LKKTPPPFLGPGKQKAAVTLAAQKTETLLQQRRRLKAKSGPGKPGPYKGLFFKVRVLGHLKASAWRRVGWRGWERPHPLRGELQAEL